MKCIDRVGRGFDAECCAMRWAIEMAVTFGHVDDVYIESHWLFRPLDGCSARPTGVRIVDQRAISGDGFAQVPSRRKISRMGPRQWIVPCHPNAVDLRAKVCLRSAQPGMDADPHRARARGRYG